MSPVDAFALLSPLPDSAPSSSPFFLRTGGTISEASEGWEMGGGRIIVAVRQQQQRVGGKRRHDNNNNNTTEIL